MRVLTLILGLALSLLAAVGEIAGLSGQVQIDRAGKTIKAEIGAQLLRGDRIRTAASARAQLVFQDDTVVTLGNGSEFAVEEFDYAGAQPKAKFSAVKGAFKVMTGQISKAAPQNFELTSRTATIGIRGTHFLGVIGADGDTVACTDGRIIVGSRDLGSPVNVAAGQLTQIMPGQIPTPPRAYTAAELQKLSASAGGESSSNGQMQPGETEGDGEQGAPQLLSLGDIVREIAPLSKQSWTIYGGWFYEDASYFTQDWAGLGSVTRFTQPNAYIEWGKVTLSIDLSEFETGEMYEGLELPSVLNYVEYWAHPASGYSLAENLPPSGTRNFSGKVAGGVMAYGPGGLQDRGEIITASSQMSMLVDFATGATSGNMQFSTTGGSSWNVNFSGGGSPGSPYFTNSATSGATGYVDGYYIGAGVEAAGGDFWLEKGTETSGELAVGVFALQ
ncbi:MAG: FecR domain-containing protein [Campylobacterales bacterium]